MSEGGIKSFGSATISGIKDAKSIFAAGKNAIKGGFNSNAEALEYYRNLSNKLDVTTERNTATFYSGKNSDGIWNRELAEEFAKTNGKTTLEQTAGGKYLDEKRLFPANNPNSPLTGDQAAEVWKNLSRRYAEQASGNAYGFVQGAREGSIFNTVEFPTLSQNPNITNIFTKLFEKGVAK